MSTIVEIADSIITSEIFALSTFQSPRNGDDLSDGEPLETEERSHTPPPRMDSPEDNLTPQLKVKVNEIYSKQPL